VKSKKQPSESWFVEAATVLGLDLSGPTAIDGVIDGHRVWASNTHGENGSWFEVRVYVDAVTLPEGLEIWPWSVGIWMRNMFSWLPFVTGYSKIVCADRGKVFVVANSRKQRDAWLTSENQERACRLSSALTHEGLMKGRHYLEFTAKLATDAAVIITGVTATVEDARNFAR